MKRLKNSHIIPALCKVSRTGKTGRTGADNSDPLAFGFSPYGFGTLVRAVIGAESFKTSDGNAFALDPAHALAFAL